MLSIEWHEEKSYIILRSIIVRKDFIEERVFMLPVIRWCKFKKKVNTHQKQHNDLTLFNFVTFRIFFYVTEQGVGNAAVVAETGDFALAT